MCMRTCVHVCVCVGVGVDVVGVWVCAGVWVCVGGCVWVWVGVWVCACVWVWVGVWVCVWVWVGVGVCVGGCGRGCADGDPSLVVGMAWGGYSLAKVNVKGGHTLKACLPQGWHLWS